MKSLLTASCLCALTRTANAETEPLVGSFTHDFTRPKLTLCGTVKKSGTAWTVLIHGSNETVSTKRSSEAEKKAFWDRMWWPTEKAKDAHCLQMEGNLQGMMCFVQSSTRAQVSDLAKKSDYFYFDQMGGLMEIRRKET